MVSDGFKWSQMVSDGLRWSQLGSDGLSSLISIAIEWLRTPKPTSGIGLGLDWDWIGLDGIRVVGGIEHLTVLISNLS